MIELDDIIIIDDVIPKEEQDILEKIATHGVRYTFLPNVASSAFEQRGWFDDNGQVGCAWTSRIRWDSPDEIIGDTYNQHFFDKCEALFRRGVEGVGFTIDHMITIATFLQVPVVNSVQRNLAHIDTPEEHLVGIYYVFDGDSPTIMFNETLEDLKDDLESDVCNPDWSMLTELGGIEAKKGRLVLFNGQRYHCSTPPRKHPRSIVNFNAVLKS